MAEVRLKGIAASDGIQMGKAYLYQLQQEEPTLILETISEEQVDEQLERLSFAKSVVKKQLEDILEKNRHRFEEKQLAILVGHKSLLDDPGFTGEMGKQIRKKLFSADKAAKTVTDKMVTLFQSMDKEYLRERAQDIQDVGGRLMDALHGRVRGSLETMEGENILVAHDVTPSDAMQLNPEHMLGFITAIGGKTSHTAILARSMGIPAIVGMGRVLEQIQDGDYLIVDGAEGICILHPESSTIAVYKEKQQQYQEELRKLESFRHASATTLDGVTFELAANIGSVEDASAGVDAGAEGVGLFRTEFMYMNAKQMPSEDEQFAIYKEILSIWKEKPVVIRTLDIGGDKELPYLPLEKETNPFLGYRAIRIGLNQPEVLQTQLRAIIRASIYGKAKIMFPMISSIEEWRKAKSFVLDIQQEFDRVGIAYDSSMELGIMAEIPSVVQIADLFAKEVDFFSIGTNDLVQYTLAVDRMNQKVAYLYDYFHPAVLRSIRTIIEAAHTEGKWVGMCGGMAGDPLAVPILAGLGLDEWSMESAALNRVKAGIASVRLDACNDLLSRVWSCSEAKDVREELTRFISSHSRS